MRESSSLVPHRTRYTGVSSIRTASLLHVPQSLRVLVCVSERQREKEQFGKSSVVSGQNIGLYVDLEFLSSEGMETLRGLQTILHKWYFTH